MKFCIKDSQHAASLVEKMSLRELINQCVCPSINVDDQFDDLEEYGSIFVHPGEQAKIKEKISQYKKNCKIPPLIAGDFENGPGSMLKGAVRFPSMMALSQTDSPEMAYEIGKVTALVGLDVGYNWTFAPVIDLVRIPDSPVVSTRSAGNTSEQVIKITRAYMDGVQKSGMMATIKHFPGDGFDIYDQHLTTPINPLNMDDWHAGPGRCYSELIEAGVMSAMPGHIALPSYDEPDAVTGLYPPATISRRLISDLLKSELGFEGLIVSDAVNMGGMANFTNYYEACARFWESGGDCLLFVKMNHFHERMERLIENRKLRIQTLKDRAYRILCIKEQMGLFDKPAAIQAIDTGAQRQLSDRVVEASVTLVRDRKGIIPFKIQKSTHILHLVILNCFEDDIDYIKQLTAELRSLSEHVDEKVDPGPESLFSDAESGGYDLIICSLGNTQDFGLNVVRLYGHIARNMMYGWMKLETPVIFVVPEHPFIHKEYEAATDTIINTYGTTGHTAKCVVDGITGARHLNRRLYAHD